MPACKTPAHRPHWVVDHRKCNYSAFNGYHRTPSNYSQVRCTISDCHSVWRTKAAYVDALPDAEQRAAEQKVCASCGKPADTDCRICHRQWCRQCLTDHHHEGYGTSLTDHR